MPEETKTNYKALVLTGIVSLAVAVGGNMLVNKFTEEKLLLAYDLVVSETFTSENGNIRIATLSIINDGSKSIDDVSLNVDLPNGDIQEYKLTGLQPNSYSIDKKDTKVVLFTKFLNPTETFSLQLLLNNPNKKEFLPFVDLRGRGVLGSQVVKEERSSLSESFLSAAIALATAMIVLSQGRIRRKILSPDMETRLEKLESLGDKHSDEQRDVTAYILSVSNLGADAVEVRSIQRKIAYWSICDHLTQKWLETGDINIYRKGAIALERLIDYAGIADKSKLLIKSNIAALYKASGQSEKADNLIKEIMASKSGVIAKRVKNFNA